MHLCAANRALGEDMAALVVTLVLFVGLGHFQVPSEEDCVKFVVGQLHLRPQCGGSGSIADICSPMGSMAYVDAKSEPLIVASIRIDLAC